eukprot:7246512-Ditylum_brightwellii.AAC.1
MVNEGWTRQVTSVLLEKGENGRHGCLCKVKMIEPLIYVKYLPGEASLREIESTYRMGKSYIITVVVMF